MENSPIAYSLLNALGNFPETIPASLLSDSQLNLLKKAADFFPPVIRFALECRMNNEEQVDLQFCIKRDEDDLNEMAHWFSKQFNGDPELQQIIDFLTIWADSSSAYHQHVTEIFLELDVLSTGIKAPLLFFELQRGLTTAALKDFCASTIMGVFGVQKRYQYLLERMIDACPEEAYVAFLGILFSRDVDVLRVNVKKLAPDAVVPFLKSIGYKWLDVELEHYIDFVYTYADRVTLCLDIGNDIYPKIGFECFWNEQPDKEIYWSHFIQNLNGSTPINQEKVKDILAWDKQIFPGQITEWPQHLWLASLQKAENEFCFLKKWISHLKLSYHPGQPVDLKAYLAYESLWKTIPLDKSPVLTTDKANQLLNIAFALDKGVDFLISSQQQSGWWKDFYLGYDPGMSDEWVTAYVGYHLAAVQSNKTKPVIAKAWTILKTRYRLDEGWAYNAVTPADADSTIWTWNFAITAGYIREFPEPGLDLTKNYLHPGGGVLTYSLTGPIGKNQRLKDVNSYHGWQISHDCVTAAHALAGKEDAIDYLLNKQNTAGHWYSYWWNGPEYATALSVEALYANDPAKHEKSINLALIWAKLRTQEELGKPAPNNFKLALLIRILLCADYKAYDLNLMNSVITILLQTQKQDGSWQANAELRMPDSDNTNHTDSEHIPIFMDENRNFGTATIIYTLNKYREVISV